MLDVSLIKQEVLAGYPEEVVLVVTSKGTYKVENVAVNKLEHFLISTSDTEKAFAEGLLAVIHSHPNWYACPSASDMQCQMSLGVPFGIISTNGVDCSDIVWVGKPETDQLIGRQFIHGVNDCYGLIKDYYKVKHSITLPEYPRDWEWWNKGKNLYIDGFSDAGFEIIPSSEASVGDMWLAQVRSPVINHGGVMYEPDIVLHHPGSKKPIDNSALSRREPVVRWAPYISLWLRHKELK